jgi:DNA-binding XRE family transcriptional regulator
MHLLNRPDHPCMAISASERAFFERLGTRIAVLRKGQNITQVEMAKTLGVSQQTINSYEVGRRTHPGIGAAHARPLARGVLGGAAGRGVGRSR